MRRALGHGPSRRGGLLIRMKAAELDRQLARGDGAVAEPLQAARAALLLRRRQRAAVADGWRRRIAAARERRQPWFSSVAPVQRDEVLMAEPAILRLIERLDGDATIDARIVARARVLLVDTGSEVYSSGPSGALRDAVTRLAGGAEAANWSM